MKMLKPLTTGGKDIVRRLPLDGCVAVTTTVRKTIDAVSPLKMITNPSPVLEVINDGCDIMAEILSSDC